ncbi:MAG TPA: trehalose-phosphatase [Steroidobacteraceae bacterium]|nr:trehalose-phosphatase [Steroidobacteraceae bacterium]
MLNTPSTSNDSELFTRPVPPQAPWCLFLDIDGTLLDIAPTPDAVDVDATLPNLLRRLERACDGAIALITGRPISVVDALFDPLQLPVAGVHGFERRNAQGHYFRPGFVGEGLSYLRSEVLALAQSLHGVLLEDKGCAFALHYRQAPNLEETIRLHLARLVSGALPAFELLDGDHVVEIKPVEHNKATAIEAFMQEEPFTGRTPVFIGDDATDLDGFAAVKRFDGLAIAVGSRIPGERRLAGPRDVRAWLESLLVA